MAAIQDSKQDPTVISSAEQPKSDISLQDAEKDLDDDDSFNIPEKYRGTATDKKEMSMLGKKQVLRVCISHRVGHTCTASKLTATQRNFRFVTMVGFASTVMASWEILLPYDICSIPQTSLTLTRLLQTVHLRLD